jgi:primosomal replication protein N
VPVNVDLVQVPLEQYARLTQGSQVRVDGVISNDGRRVLATSVVALAASESERR